MGRRIILTGVHGVGKGYYLQENVIGKFDVDIVSASGLISKYKNPTDAGYKLVTDVNDNQEILFKALKQQMLRQTKSFILDGHITILNSNKQIERIPYYYFERNCFDTIILMQDSSNQILKRLQDRDTDAGLSIELIDLIQKEEKKYALELENKGIEVLEINPRTEVDYIKKYLY